eukprot:CAMPEP_0202386636 /NCGR_PEP_ID=MMETSP1127-20130417/67679_1 /ASSEMBLY_ACC=CAM_ASM_000462 /TAXON_ID=3047 /ORGANISM="Dunaliella tertiolecta, Strain CCMP1320" /LENGTH=112 /DNA_ID=CAMNT_0048987297 /DNA_START=239 /DNA_END=575 /DNA_ORIENTATION=+
MSQAAADDERIGCGGGVSDAGRRGGKRWVREHARAGMASLGTQAAGGGADGAAGGVGVGAAGRGVVVQLVGLQWCRWWPPSCIQAAGAGEAQEGMGGRFGGTRHEAAAAAAA